MRLPLFLKKGNKEIVAPPKDNRFILSLDGGGLRGIIPATILVALESAVRTQEKLQGLYTKAFQSYFDVISGTSTGGLLALALTVPSSLPRSLEAPGQIDFAELPKIYQSNAQFIFTKEDSSLLGMVNHLFKPKYTPVNLSRLLAQWFGDQSISKASTALLIISYDAAHAKLYEFKSTDEMAPSAWDAGLATSAAPSYFPAHAMGSLMLLDGGVIANNPSIYAYRYAKSLYPKADTYNILSIGTGSTPFKVTETSSGLFDWANNIAPLYGTTQHQNMADFVKLLEDATYTRLDAKAPRKSVKMDDAEPATLSLLDLMGKKAVEDCQQAIDSYASALVQNRISKEKAEYASQASQAGRKAAKIMR
ncbi:MAG: patatin-like phospholipase family protein [Sphaerochaetaceae bacterium]|jgi:patatin-like phospholipase/acyl hydrolase